MVNLGVGFLGISWNYTVTQELSNPEFLKKLYRRNNAQIGGKYNTMYY